MGEAAVDPALERGGLDIDRWQDTAADQPVTQMLGDVAVWIVVQCLVRYRHTAGGQFGEQVTGL